ncbi:MAG: DUF4290 domain-containing protein [Bacteroidales bacterium]|nr:DUF4290 domain-containing protein [Bacteroidales bacterium]
MEYDYNTQRTKMVIPEYGRNIQKMIEYTVQVEDREERNRAARAIIAIMGNLNPHLRDVSDFKHKLWDHLFIISDFKLDIDSPYEKPTPDILFEKPKQVPYKNNTIKYKHYGKIIELLIQEASGFEEGEEKDALIRLIANHMKKCYVTWNRDVVDDKTIFEDLKNLSGGKIIAGEDLKLSDTRDILLKSKKKRPPKKK